MDAGRELLMSVTGKLRLRPANAQGRPAPDVIHEAIRAMDRLEPKPRHQGVVERDAFLKAARPKDDMGDAIDLQLVPPRSAAQPSEPIRDESLPATNSETRRRVGWGDLTSAKDEIVGVFSRAAPSYDAVGPRQVSYFARRL